MRGTKKIAATLVVVAAVAGAIGCGNSDPEPSIPLDDAEGLAARIDEIRANVDNGSCVVAQSRTDDLISEINDLPDEVNQDVQNALAEGANNLKGLIEDECDQEEETTTEETTTEEDTTTEETTTEETQPTIETQTTPTQPTTPTNPGGGGSGGVGPGGIGSP